MYYFSEYHSRIALVQFSTKTVVEFGLNQFKTKNDLFNGLDEAKGRYKNLGYNSFAGLKLGLDLFRFRRAKQTSTSQVIFTIFYFLPYSNSESFGAGDSW